MHKKSINKNNENINKNFVARSARNYAPLEKIKISISYLKLVLSRAGLISKKKGAQVTKGRDKNKFCSAQANKTSDRPYLFTKKINTNHKLVPFNISAIDVGRTKYLPPISKE